jgi:hypothetical protein
MLHRLYFHPSKRQKQRSPETPASTPATAKAAVAGDPGERQKGWLRKPPAETGNRLLMSYRRIIDLNGEPNGVRAGKPVTGNRRPFTDRAIASGHQQRYAAHTPAI